ncbi:hypothetical protein ACFLVE_03940 [Chloroflexota bacterium]
MIVNQIKRLKARLKRAKARLLGIPAVQLIYRTAEGSGNHDVAHLAAGELLQIFRKV